MELAEAKSKSLRRLQRLKRLQRQRLQLPLTKCQAKLNEEEEQQVVPILSIATFEDKTLRLTCLLARSLQWPPTEHLGQSRALNYMQLEGLGVVYEAGWLASATSCLELAI